MTQIHKQRYYVLFIKKSFSNFKYQLSLDLDRVYGIANNAQNVQKKGQKRGKKEKKNRKIKQ